MIICKKDNLSPCPLISSVILEKSPERPAPSNKLPSPLPQHASPTTHHPPLTDTTRRRAMIDWRFSGAALLFPQPDENCGIADAGTPHLLRTPLRVTSACSAACRPGRPHYHIHNASGYRFLNATPVPLFAFFFFRRPHLSNMWQLHRLWGPHAGGAVTEEDGADGWPLPV